MREGGRIQLRCRCNLWLDLKRALAPSPPSTCVCGRAVWEAPSGNPGLPAGSLMLPLPETPFRLRPAEGSPFSVDVCSGSQRWCPAVAPFPLEAAGHAIQASGAQLHCPRSTAIKMKKSFCKILYKSKQGNKNFQKSSPKIFVTKPSNMSTVGFL